MSSKTQMVGAGHHVRAKTNIPVIGVLTQPILEGTMTDQYHKIKKQVEESHSSNDHSEEFPSAQYIEVTHVKFLESAGARVVPIDFTLTAEELKKSSEKSMDFIFQETQRVSSIMAILNSPILSRLLCCGHRLIMRKIIAIFQ